MDFEFDERQEGLRESCRRLIEFASPIARVRELFDDPLGFDQGLWKGAAELGWFRLLVPEEYGGRSITSQPLVDLVVVAEELGRLVQPGPYVSTSIVAFAIAQAGSEAQKQEFLPDMSAGRLLGTWCTAEREGEWDVSCTTTEVNRTASGVVLDGEKRYVQDAEAADVLLVSARMGAGVVQVLVPRNQPGVELSLLRSLDITRRLYDVKFNSVELPESALLAKCETGECPVEEQLRLATVLQCAESAAGIQQLVALSSAYGKQRVQFDKPIGSFQAIKHKIANLHLQAHSASCATHYAAMAMADRNPDAAVAVSIAKMYVADAYAQVASESIQLHGGAGFTWNSDIHLYLRRAKSNQVLLGDPDSHRERLCQLLGV